MPTARHYRKQNAGILKVQTGCWGPYCIWKFEGLPAKKPVNAQSCLHKCHGNMVGCVLPDVCKGVVIPRKDEQLGSATDVPGDIDGHFLDENRGQNTRPILLFDPNGTLNT